MALSRLWASVGVGLSSVLAFSHAWIALASPGAQFVARTSLEDGYELPPQTDFANDPVVLNDRGDVAVALTAAQGALIGAVWVMGAEGSKWVYGERGAYLLRDLRFTATGQLVFERVNPELAPGGERGAEFFMAPFVSSDGRVGYRARMASGAQLFGWEGARSGGVVAATLPFSVASLYSYLFTPSINERLEFASKARLGSTPEALDESQPDEIRLWRADGSSRLVASDRDGDPASPFAGFDNGVALSPHGRVAFVAQGADGVRAVWSWSEGALSRVAAVGSDGVSDIALFHVAVNDAGTVVFRGKDAEGRAAVFAARDARVSCLVREGDLLPSDLGSARLAARDPSMSSAISGGISLNASGMVAFRGTTVALEGMPRPVWSSAIYKVSATR
jgi:hypothetical protein